MQAVILAGGLGTRLLPITKDVPKPMVPVAGVPYLQHQLNLLRRQSITDVVLLTGYLGDQIESYFGDGQHCGVTMRYCREDVPLGTGGALRQARPLLQRRFLVIYGDSYLPIDYAPVLRALEQTRVRGVVVAYDNRFGDTSVRSNLALASDDRVVAYDKAPDNPSRFTHVEAGVLAFEESALDLLPAEGKVSLEQVLFPALIARGELLAVRTEQRFYDIGTPERLQAIEAMLTHDHHTHSI